MSLPWLEHHSVLVSDNAIGSRFDVRRKENQSTHLWPRGSAWFPAISRKPLTPIVSTQESESVKRLLLRPYSSASKPNLKDVLAL